MTLKRYTTSHGTMCDAAEVADLESLNTEMLEILESLEHCSDYWSEYYVPIGIVDKMRSVIAQAKGGTNEQ